MSGISLRDTGNRGRRWRRSQLAALLSGILMLSGLTLISGPEASANTCTSPLAPVLRSSTINQGLGSYARLARGKTTMFRAYLSLPSCSASTDTIRLASAEPQLTMTGPGGTKTYTPFSPTVGTYVNSYANAPANDYVGDPKFLIPGADLAPAATTLSYTLGFSLTVAYTASDASGVVKTVTLTPQTGTSLSATVEARTNALRILVVPMGDFAAGYANQFSSSAYSAVQNGISAAGRMLPVPDGATMDLRDPAVTGALPGGMRYFIDPVLGIDLGQAGLNYMTAGGGFCMTGDKYQNIAPKLATYLATYNAKNPGQTADRVLGVVDQAHALDPIPNGCDIGVTLGAGSDTAYALAITSPSPAATQGSVSGTGATIAQELGHTWGLTPFNRADGSGVHSPNSVAYDVASTFRSYNLANVNYLDPMTSTTAARPVMKVVGSNWDDAHSLYEVPDFAFDLCVFGGQVQAGVGGCVTPSTVGTSSGVQAGPVFVMAGSTDGTAAGTSINESYFTSDSAVTPGDPTSPYYLTITRGNSSAETRIPVSFAASEHVAGAPAATRGTFRVTIPSDVGDQIQLWKGAPNAVGSILLYTRHRGAGAPTVRATQKSASGWQARGRESVPRFASAGAFLNGRFYVAGGLAPASTSISSAFESYDPATDSWTALPSMTRGVRDAAAVAVGGKIYVMGGATSGVTDSDQAGATSAVQVFDPAANAGKGQWSPGPFMLSSRWGLGVAAIGSKIFAIGGTNVDGTILSSVEYLDTSLPGPLSVWTSTTKLPAEKREISPVVLGGKIYVFGGSSNLLPQTSSVDVFDPSTSVWSPGPALRQARADGLAGVCNGSVYLAGGIISPSQTIPGLLPSPYVERFDPAANGGSGGYVDVPSQQLPTGLEDFAAGEASGPTGIMAVTTDGTGPTASPMALTLPCDAPTQVNADATTPTAPTAAQPNPGADLRAEVLLACPGPGSASTVFPLAVGLTPSQASGQNATFSYPIDRTRVCNSGAVSVVVNDGIQLSAPAAAGTVSTGSKAPIPALAYPLADATFLQYDGISLRGTAVDPTEGSLWDSQLTWSIPGLLSQSVNGREVNLTPPANGWPAGDYTVTLTATDSAGLSTSSSTQIHLQPDADHDGMGPNKEGVAGCGTSDSNPLDAFAISQNGIPNTDDPDPCHPKTTPYLALSYFYPQQVSVAAGNDNDEDDKAVYVGVSVPYRDSTQVNGTSVRLTSVAGYNTSDDPGFASTGWTAQSAGAVATFDRQHLVAFLQSHNIHTGQVAVTIEGSAPTWRFSGDTSFLVVTSPHDSDNDGDD
ncbi:MAG: hypothetical protein NVS3B26_00060 [Mycobacteriales bacterium]